MTHAGGDRVAARRSMMNGLMLAFAFTLPYHVMRTAAAAGLRIHILGDGASRGLRTSRYCRAYHRTRFAGDRDVLLAEIEALVHRHAIDVILPSDDVSTRLLATLGERLPVPSTPLPDPATFDLLNDKWSFGRFCRQNGVRAPEGWLFDNIAELREAFDNGVITLPVTVKPTNRSGGVGVLHLREPAELALLAAVDYRPILVQRHITGETVGISVLCDRGRIVAHAVQRRDATRFELFADAALLADVTRLVALTGCHGPANFDAVRSDEDGFCYIVECNPRYWYSIYLAMLAGLNFIDLALSPFSARPHPVVLDRGAIRLSLRNTLTRPWRATRLDRKLLLYTLSDPIAFTLQRAKSYDDSVVAVPVGDMTGGARVDGLFGLAASR